MSDATDEQIVAACYNDIVFQDRVRYRFITAAISVCSELNSTANHSDRVRFAGSLFAGFVNSQMLCMVVLSNPSIRASCISSGTSPWANITDSDIDFQVASVFTGLAVSRSWQ